jgi:hypothetical protein
VTVTLTQRRGAIEFTVTDDGLGTPRERDTNGIGITGMRDRIEAVGGQFEIVSPPGLPYTGRFPTANDSPRRRARTRWRRGQKSSSPRPTSTYVRGHRTVATFIPLG